MMETLPTDMLDSSADRGPCMKQARTRQVVFKPAPVCSRKLISQWQAIQYRQASLKLRGQPRAVRKHSK
jgi:hypothetical protein